MKLSSGLFLSGVVAVRASTDLEDKLPLPSKQLVWGDVNFVHTTDIHGEHVRIRRF